MSSPLHPQALDLLAAAGVTVEPHRTDPALWVYTLPSGQQGAGETPQRAAALALDHLRAALLDLQALVDTLDAELAALRAQARAAGLAVLGVADELEGRPQGEGEG